jgi:peroxin-5
VLASPGDTDLLACTAVICFIGRDYSRALSLFRQVVKIRPDSYDVWNKMGAVLAHMGEADQAIECYERALEYHPTYVKAWSNLSIAYAFKHQHDQAARLLLNSLLIRPQAKHLWTCLHSIFMQTGRNDLIPKIAGQDPEAFRGHYDLMTKDDLPAPESHFQKNFR